MNNSMKKHTLDNFVQRMVRPEVRGLILQYALESPFKKDIIESANAKKDTHYRWCDCGDGFQLWRLKTLDRKLHVNCSLMLEEFKDGHVECFDDGSIAYLGQLEKAPDGEYVEEISLDDAKAIADRVGEPVPARAVGAARPRA